MYQSTTTPVTCTQTKFYHAALRPRRHIEYLIGIRFDGHLRLVFSRYYQGPQVVRRIFRDSSVSAAVEQYSRG